MAAAGMKNFSRTFKMLGDYDVHKFYVERESLAERGLTIEDLMQITYEAVALFWRLESLKRGMSKATLQ